MSEWVCFEHHRYDVGDNKRIGWEMAVRWFNEAKPYMQIASKLPTSIDMAIDASYYWSPPDEIKIKKKGKYYNVLERKYIKSKKELKKVLTDDEDKDMMDIFF